MRVKYDRQYNIVLGIVDNARLDTVYSFANHQILAINLHSELCH